MKEIKTKLQNPADKTSAVSAPSVAGQIGHAPSSPTIAAAGSNPEGSDFPETYNDIPYTDIVAAWLAADGIEGDVAEGARNTELYRLAREMRYIMDFNIEFMLQRLPRWGLSETEARTTLQSAITSPRGTQLPKQLSAAIAQLKRALAPQDSEVPDMEGEHNPLPLRLPPLFNEIAQRYRRYSKTAILAALPEVGTLLSRLRSTYTDGTMQSPIFFTVVQAPQASGKSFAREMSEWLTHPIEENDQLERVKDNDYNNRLKLAKNAKEQPEDPKAVIRLLPPTTSNSTLLKRAVYAQGLALYTFAEEIDTIVRSNKAGTWSEKNDIYRMAFDGAKWGQDYMSQNSFSGLVNLHYNLLILGTPLAVAGFFKKVEDGMASRFIVCHLPDNRGEALSRPVELSAVTRRRTDALIRRAHEEGSGEKEIRFSLPRTLSAIDRWQTERIAEFDRDPDNFALDILRRRSAVIGFRAAMLAWWLCGRHETDIVVDFALWVASEVLSQQLIHFGDEMNRVERASLEKQNTQERKARMGRNGRLLVGLGNNFTKGDVIAARKRLGYDGDCSYVISRWLTKGLIAKSPTDKTRYVKLPQKPNAYPAPDNPSDSSEDNLADPSDNSNEDPSDEPYDFLTDDPLETSLVPDNP